MTKNRVLIECADGHQHRNYIEKAARHFLTLVPTSGCGVITVPFPKDLGAGSTTGGALIAAELGRLTQGKHEMQLPNGATLRLCTTSAHATTLERADALLAIWPTCEDLDRFERIGTWSNLVVVGFHPDDWTAWANRYSPSRLT